MKTLKQEQQILVDDYNKSSSKKRKRELYAKIMEIEDKLLKK